MARRKKPNPWKISNPNLMQAMQELRRSSAASRHTLKTYKGSRQARKQQAIHEQFTNQ